MKPLAESLTSFATTTELVETRSSIGTVLGRIGCGKPLTASAALAALHPAETDQRVETSLERISGQRPVFRSRNFIPNDGPTYSVIEAVRWDCPQDKLPEVVAVLEGAFRGAPEDQIASALFKLRIMTRAREQRSEEMQEAEAMIWIEQLRGYPGDIVLDVLKTWTKRPNGQWWPTWHEVEEELKKRADRRQSLLNFVRRLVERPSDMKAITDQPPTKEERDRAVEYYEQHIRPALSARDAPTKPQEDPQAALERIKSEGWGNVQVSPALTKILGINKNEQAA
jgi:hypothetical protein